MPTCCSTGCCDDCCPTIVPVTQTVTSVTIADQALDISIADVDANTKTITVQVEDADAVAVLDFFRIKFWFVDSSTPTEEKSLIVPTNPGVDEWDRVTDTNGLLVFTVQNTGALRTWYLCATLGVGIEISAAITIGT